MSFLDELPREYQTARLPRVEHGAILANGVQIASTQRCVHCGAHFMVETGSGKVRGWCRFKCNGPTCGRPECYECKPFERWLEEVERRATLEARLGIG